jgi:hypothetical protein
MFDVKRRGSIAVHENHEVGGRMASAWHKQTIKFQEMRGCG